MDKIKIELDRKDAEYMYDLLGQMNYYMVAAVLSKHDSKRVELNEEDYVKAMDAVTHTYAAIDRELDK